VTVRFLAEAEAELDDAVAYYEAQLAGLGSDFAAEVQAGIARIKEYPEAWQLLGRRVRRYRLNRFPYGLLYAVLDNEIVIGAVRKPNYWHARTTEM